MSNMLSVFEQEQIDKLTQNKANYDEFAPGDKVVVKVKIGERFQNYEGVCIAIKNRGLNSSFTVRKISYGCGVERVFPYYSPNIDSVTNIKRGKVRRAKLYYLKDRVGKATKIAEKVTGYKGKLTALAKAAKVKK